VGLDHLLSELKRRKVFRVAIVYAGVAFVLSQAAALLQPALLLPAWSYRLIVLLLILGFPVAVLLAWAYEIAPDGFRRTPRGAEPPTEERGTESKAAWTSETSRAAPRPWRAQRIAAVGGSLVLAGAAGALLLRTEGERTVAAVAGPDRSIAVLPFLNLSPDPGNEYFSDGITEDVLTQLSRIADLTVVSRTSVMGYKGSTRKLGEIGTELGVSYIVEGSVRRMGDRVRISAQLVNARTDRRIWADVYDRDLTDIFVIQSEIARQIAGALHARLTPVEERRILARPTGDVEAYELYLKGRDYYHRHFGGANDSAVVYFRQAIRRDPNFALAHAGLAAAYSSRSQRLGWPDSALVVAHTAVSLDPELAEAHNAVGLAEMRKGRYREALAAFERAVERNPGYTAALSNIGVLHATVGQLDQALGWFHRGLELEPAGPERVTILHNLAEQYVELQMIPSAERTLERLRILQPGDPMWYHFSVQLAIVTGEYGRAVALSEELETRGWGPGMAIMTGDAHLFVGDYRHALVALDACCEGHEFQSHFRREFPVLLAYASEKTGDTQRAGSLLAAFEPYALSSIEDGDQSPGLRYSLAAALAIRHRNDEAVHWLEEAVAKGWMDYAFTLRDPLLENIRDEPGFMRITNRMRAEVDRMRARVDMEGW
jgi:TolB-like protein/tetratricopeptide (TPR) repeat protein